MNITTKSTKLQQYEIGNKENVNCSDKDKITIIYMVLIMDSKHYVVLVYCKEDSNFSLKHFNKKFATKFRQLLSSWLNNQMNLFHTPSWITFGNTFTIGAKGVPANLVTSTTYYGLECNTRNSDNQVFGPMKRRYHILSKAVVSF